jgi:hypothetical protein
VVFKGSGFYRTDSREEKRASKAEAKVDGGGGKSGDGGSGGKAGDGAKADGGGGKSADAASGKAGDGSSGKAEKKSPDTKSTPPSKAPKPAVEKSSKKS